MPMLRRTHAHHRDVRTGMRAEVPAGHRAHPDQDRYVMIEIALSITTRRRPLLPFLPLTVSQRRRRSLDDAAPTSCDRRRHAKPDPNAGGARSKRFSQGGALNSFGECRRSLALVPCRLPMRRFQLMSGFCSRDDRVYRCVQRLMGGWISRHHNGLRHAETSLDSALHGFFWPNPVQGRDQSSRN